MGKRHVVELFTDGACSGNPGAGGYAAILRSGIHEKQMTGGYKLTTNNRMELLAVIKGLEALKQPSNVTVTTDSKYVEESYTKGWCHNWLSRPNFGGKKNRDLWVRLITLGEKHNLKFVRVKGHAGHPENEMCDKLAVAATKGELLVDLVYLETQK